MTHRLFPNRSASSGKHRQDSGFCSLIAFQCFHPQEQWSHLGLKKNFVTGQWSSWKYLMGPFFKVFKIFQYRKCYLCRSPACVREAWFISSLVHFPLCLQRDWAAVCKYAPFRKGKKAGVSWCSWYLWGLYHSISREKSFCLFHLQTCCLTPAISEL